MDGTIGSVGDVDYFSISLATGDTLQFQPPNADLDGSTTFAPSLELLTSAGEVKASSLTGQSIAFTASASGTYLLRLTSTNLFGTFTGSYSIAATVIPFNGTTEVEANNSAASANALLGKTNFRGSLSNAGDVDYFSFSGAAGQGVSLKFAEKPSLNPSVRLYSPSGTLLVVSQSGQGFSTTLAESGSYRIAVQADNSAGAVTGSYVGQLLFATEPTLDAESGNGFDSATVLDLGPYLVSGVYLSPDQTFATSGLRGSYVDRNLRGTAVQNDWVSTQVIAGQRIDPSIHFPQDDWGNRAALGLTHGTDANWDEFSVQWDGYIRIVTNGTQLFTTSDDGSRMWIDLNGDGVFNAAGSEFVSNNWGNGQAANLGPGSISLVPGVYKIRIQYEEGLGGNNAFLLWSDKAHSAGAVAINNHQEALGVLSSLSDIDVYAVDLTGTGFYDFSLESTVGAIATQGRLLTLYNEFGQPLESTVAGRIATDRMHVRVESNSRYFISVQALNDDGLGAYDLNARIYREFPTYRDIPLYYQDYSTYDRQAQVAEFLAFFEARYDIYQIDLTQTNPGTDSEHVDWSFTKSEPGTGSAGVGGGYFGIRRVSGGGEGHTEADWNTLRDVWFGVIYHETGHGSGLPHTGHPLEFMSYGGQYDYSPVGSYNRVGNDGRITVPKLQNQRNYLDWVLEAGRIVPEEESNDSLLMSQRLAPYFAEMSSDADVRNDQVVVVGTVSNPADVDLYRISVTSGQLFSFDIDAAEFQYPLDALLQILDGSGTVLASNFGGIDRDSGITSVDPSLTYQFQTTGDYYIRVASEFGTFGNYRLKVAPSRVLDQSGPRIAAAWPDGGTTIDSTQQLVFWLNDQLDPATLTSSNFIVNGRTNGVRAGVAVFDPLTSTLTWNASAPLPPDVYTITLKSGSGGITDLQGNQLDGESDGTLSFPEVSGNGTRGGDFQTSFTVSQLDTVPASVTYSNYSQQEHNRGMFDIYFNDELDIVDVYSKPFTLRGSGPDRAFNTADDTFSPVDVVYDPISNTADHLLRVYSRGPLDLDKYRVEASLVDAAGKSVTLAQSFDVMGTVGANFLFTSPATTTSGLQGTYINQSLRNTAAQTDWRTSQVVSGTRIDSVIDFGSESFGQRSPVGITGGTDANWDEFSVQWDGVIVVPANGIRLATRSDDGSRMWIDVNGDGVFNTTGAEFINNNWGNGQAVTTGPVSQALNAGTYRIRIQYEEGFGGNRMQLMWDYGDAAVNGIKQNLKVVGLNLQPNTVLATAPTSIDVTFSASVAVASLTTSNFQVRYSPDSTFFDGNDSFLTDSNDAISWNPTLRKASFQPASPLRGGYYLVELNGDAGGIASPIGRLLDGEYRSTNIAGFTPQYGWNESPSGDGIPGGDYRAMFIVAAPSIALSVSTASFSETAGVAAASLIVTRKNGDASTPLTVTLSSSDTTEATVPGSVTIPAGQLSVTFPIAAVDDTQIDGTQTVVLTAQAAGYGSSTATVSVTDNEVPELFLSLSPASISENGGQSTATIQRTGSTTSALTVTLTSNDTGEATVPVSVVIPAGQSSATFAISAVDDQVNDGSQIVKITASASGFASISSNLTVTNNQKPTISNIGNQAINKNSSTGVIEFLVNDAESPATTLVVTVTSSNGSLVSNGNIVLGGNGANRTLTVTPISGAFGQTTITVTASDGSASSSAAFVLSVNDTPNMSVISDQSVNEDASTGAIGFTVNDTDSAADSLAVTVSSSNASLIPNSSITLGGSGANRTVAITPLPDQSGASTITLSVRDAGPDNVPNNSDDVLFSRSFNVTVNSINDPPTYALMEGITVLEDAPAQLIANFLTTAVPGPPNESAQSLVLSISNDNEGLFSIQPSINLATGELTFTPLPDIAGTANVTVILVDNGSNLAPNVNLTEKTFTITILPVNVPPSFHLESGPSIIEDAGAQTVSGFLSGASAGPANESGQTLSINVTNDNPGLFSVQPSIDLATGNLTYMASPNANGSAVVTVTLGDSGNNIAPSVNFTVKTFTIAVAAVNDAPSFELGTDLTVSKTSSVQKLVAFLTNPVPGPSNEAAESLSLTVSNDNNSLFSRQPSIDLVSGDLTFTPAANMTGVAVVTVTLADSGGDVLPNVNLTQKMFRINVVAINAAPTFTIGADVTVVEDTPAQTVSHFLTQAAPGPADESEQILSISVSNDNNGLFLIQPDIDLTTGNLTFFPAIDANGSATITITLTDSGSNTAPSVNFTTKTFTINVVPVNDSPMFILGNDLEVFEDAGPQTLAGYLSNASAGPSDESTQTLSVSISNDNSGLFSIQPSINLATGNLIFTPAPNSNGSATVTVTLTDSGSNTTPNVNFTSKTFTINVAPVNDRPTFNLGSNQVLLEDAGPQTVVGFLSNSSPGPSNESAQTLSVRVSTDNSGLFVGQPTIDLATGNLNFTSAPNLSGVATVTVLVTDSGSDTAANVNFTSKTFTINVVPVNDRPTFDLGSHPVVLEDAGPQTIAGFLTNSSAGPLNESAQVLSLNVANNNAGLFSTQPRIDLATGTLTFTPAANANGFATVTVQLSDDGSNTAPSVNVVTKTFMITVNLQNDAPAAEDGSVITVEDSTKNGMLIATDVDNVLSELTFHVVEEPLHGFVVITNAHTGTYSYTPRSDYHGPDRFTFRAGDGIADSNVATIVINVTAVNDSPIASGATVTTLEDTPQSGELVATDVDDVVERLTIIIVDRPMHGTVNITNIHTGTYIYTPATNYNGPDRFTFRVSDGVNNSNLAAVSMTVAAENDAPEIGSNGSISLPENSTAVTVVTATDADLPAPSISYSISGGADSSKFEIDPFTGALSFVSAPDFEVPTDADGNNTFEVTVRATDDGSPPRFGLKTLIVTVTDQNEAPQLSVGGPAVTWIKKRPPVIVLPQIAIAGDGRFEGGHLSINLTAAGRRKALDSLQVPAYTALGTGTGPIFENGLISVQIQLNQSASINAIQSFLRGITFSTKGGGLRSPVRTLTLTLTNAAGLSARVSQTIHVRKKA